MNFRPGNMVAWKGDDSTPSGEGTIVAIYGAWLWVKVEGYGVPVTVHSLDCEGLQ